MKTFQFTSLWNVWSKLKDSSNSASSSRIYPQAQNHPLTFALLTSAGFTNIPMIENNQVVRCIELIARISPSVLMSGESNVLVKVQCWLRKTLFTPLASFLFVSLLFGNFLLIYCLNRYYSRNMVKKDKLTKKASSVI